MPNKLLKLDFFDVYHNQIKEQGGRYELLAECAELAPRFTDSAPVRSGFVRRVARHFNLGTIFKSRRSRSSRFAAPATGSTRLCQLYF
jgi:hypothetical protein